MLKAVGSAEPSGRPKPTVMCKSKSAHFDGECRYTSRMMCGSCTVEACPTCVSWCQEVNMTSTSVRDPELADLESRKAAHYCPETSQGITSD